MLACPVTREVFVMLDVEPVVLDWVVYVQSLVVSIRRHDRALAEQLSRSSKAVALNLSEMLSEQLKRRGMSHQVLNAKNHEHEAGTIAQAGRLAAVTVSTNMAGRGTDIILGGSDTSQDNWQDEHDEVVHLGGLHVIGTEHHDARRIDNQLRGRAGRQGDPGSSQFYISLDDELMRRFGGDRIKTFMGWTGMDEDAAIENKWVTKSIGNAQVKVESYHFDIRKHLLDFDDVLNNQRGVIYNDRHEILAGGDLKGKILGMLRQEFQDLMDRHLAGRHADDWNPSGLLGELEVICPLPPDMDNEDKVYQWSRDQIGEILSEYAETAYQAREQEVGSEQMRLLERLVMLRAIDTHWVSHLTSMENLRTGIGLQAYGQRDPLVMYRAEGHKMFQDLLARMQYDVVHSMFHVSIVQEPVNGRRRPNGRTTTGATPMQAVNPQGREKVGAAKVGRNAPCPCGSGTKYKRCHGANV